MKFQSSINELTLQYFRLPTLMTIVLLSISVAALVVSIDYVVTGKFNYIAYMALAYIPSFIIVAYLPIFVRNQLMSYASKCIDLVDLPKLELDEWWQLELKKLFDTRLWLVSLATLGVIGPYFFIYQTKWWTWPYQWFTTRYTEWSVFFAIIFLVYWGNEFFTVLVKLPGLLTRFGQLPIRQPMYLDPEVGLVALGSIMFRTSILAVLSYSIFTLVAFSYTPLGDVFGIEVLIIFAFFGISIIGVFFLSLYNIHRVMVRYKYIEMRRIALYLWMALQALDSNSSSEEVEVVFNLQQVHDSLAKTVEWPFRRGQLASLVLATASPILLTIFDKIISFYLS